MKRPWLAATLLVWMTACDGTLAVSDGGGGEGGAPANDAPDPSVDAWRDDAPGLDANAPDAPVPLDASAAPDAASLVCSAPLGDCNADPSDGCETDLQTSSAHCGRCGRSCGAAACTAGECAPTEFLATTPGNPTPIVVDATHVYFGTDQVSAGSYIYSLDRRSLSPATTLASPPLGGPYSFAVQGTSLYVGLVGSTGFSTTAWGVALPGGPTRPLITSGLPAAGLTLPTVAASASEVFIADRAQRCMGSFGSMCCSPGVPCSGGRIFRVAGAGGPLVLVKDDENAPTSIATDGTNVYWGNDGNLNVAGAPTLTREPAVRMIPVAGGTATTLVALATGTPVSVTAPGDGFVYYGVRAPAPDSGIHRVPVTGGPAELLLSGERLVGAIAVHGSALAWTAHDGTRFVARYRDMAGATPRTVHAPTAGSVVGIAMDAEAIYVTAGPPVRVVRVVR